MVQVVGRVTRLTALLVVVLVPSSASGQANQPRTTWGDPDLQGVWSAAFLTRLQRPPGVNDLIVDLAQAKVLAERFRDEGPALEDPQIGWDNISELARVRGEHRTSIIVEPKDGRIPFTQMALDVAAGFGMRFRHGFDHAGQRPLSDRCLENFAYPPIRPFPAFIPHQVFQSRDLIAIVSESLVSVRMIHLGGAPPPSAVRSIEGYAMGHWEGDTLVVRTTHLRAVDPFRLVLGGPLLLSRNSVITERFTRVSDTELVYQFTIEDDALYTQPWAGEFSLTRHDVPMYEYACHEGNYSMDGILAGHRAEEAEAAAGR